MKTKRITVLTSPEFKVFLEAEAKKEGISVSELVRRRCERMPSEDEEVLAVLASELKRSVAQAKQALAEGLRDIQGAFTSTVDTIDQGKAA